MEVVSAQVLYRLYNYLHDYRKASAGLSFTYSQQAYGGSGYYFAANIKDLKGIPADVPIVAGAIALRGLEQMRTGSYYEKSSAADLVAESLVLFRDTANAVCKVRGFCSLAVFLNIRL